MGGFDPTRSATYLSAAALERIIGKRIPEIAVFERTKRQPRVQIHLVFDDGTNIEFFGEFRPSRPVGVGDAASILRTALA